MARRRSECVACVLDRRECGGPGGRALYRVDRKLGAVCATTRRDLLPYGRRPCNVCGACCDQPGVGYAGQTCTDCEASTSWWGGPRPRKQTKISRVWSLNVKTIIIC